MERTDNQEDHQTSQGENNQTNNEQNHQGEQSDANVEEILIKHLESMFEFDNLKSNTYLVPRLNMNLELDPNYIFTERSVHQITHDAKIIDSALQKCKNADYKPGQLLRLKTKCERKTLLVKGISKDDEAAFRKLIQDVCDQDEKTKEFKYDHNEKTDCVELTFNDESAALKVFSELLNKKLQDKSIDCMIRDENTYIGLHEQMRAHKKPYAYHKQHHNNYYQHQQQQQQMMMNPYGYPGNYPMYPMGPQYQMFDKPRTYIRKNKDNYRNNNNNNYNNNTSNASTGADTPGSNTDKYNNENGNNNQGGYQQRGNNNYQRGGYQKKRYEGGKNYTQEGEEERKPQKQYKKVLSTQEIEKITSVDQDNYPPLN